MNAISVSLPGTSIIGVGCVCDKLSQQWIQRNDVWNTVKCMRCDRSWHYCPLHYTQLSGIPNLETTPKFGCICKKQTTQTSGKCPKCNSPEYITPHESLTTKVCKQCKTLFHSCPLHFKSVIGPGYHPSAREQTMCQCHENPSFLSESWAKPFQ